LTGLFMVIVVLLARRLRPVVPGAGGKAL
jgi:hypothetical protein